MNKTAIKPGDKYGKLTVISRAPNIKYSTESKTAWYCDCDCGTKNIIASTHNLRSGEKQSCGCLVSECRRKYNKYNLSGEYGIGYTNKGEIFYFDLEDYEKIKKYCWRIDVSSGYVICRDINNKDANHPSVLWMHDVIMNTKYVDHIGGSQTRNDNRKENLRIMDGNKNKFYSHNSMNRQKSKNNTSGVTGVSYYKNIKKWRAYITCNYKRINLGIYETKEEAVKARKKAEEELFKEWSYDNSQKIKKEIM